VATVAGPKGTRRVPLSKFFVLPSEDFTRETVLDPGEILVEIVLPKPAAGERGSYRKVRSRGAWDFALAGIASAVVLEAGKVRRARLVLSGVAPVPWRIEGAEKAILGHPLDAASARAAAEAAVKGAQPLAQNRWKVDVVRGVVEEALLALA
jgi:xanthine dehydrogenase YagS FAD-binding subunit